MTMPGPGPQAAVVVVISSVSMLKFWRLVPSISSVSGTSTDDGMKLPNDEEAVATVVTDWLLCRRC